MSSNINFLVQTQYNLLTLLFSSMRKIKDGIHLSLCQKRKRKRKKRLFFVKKKTYIIGGDIVIMTLRSL
jgi:hypothetical protein